MRKSFFYLFFCEAFLVSILYLTIYIVVQQVVRQSANSPQIQMAEDTAYGLSNGQSPEILLNTPRINPLQSLAPFTIVYDIKGNVLSTTLSSSVYLPEIPKGVLEYVQARAEDRFTWQPKSNLRIAAVMTEYVSKNGGGFVLVGRSLREVENLESYLENIVGTTWIMSLILIFIFTRIYFGKKNN